MDHLGQRAEHLVGPQALDLVLPRKVAAYSRHGHGQQRHRLAPHLANLWRVLLEEQEHDCTVKLCHVHDLIVARREVIFTLPLASGFAQAQERNQVLDAPPVALRLSDQVNDQAVGVYCMMKHHPHARHRRVLLPA
eukprot:6734385-Prymnesium_polylepis.1